MKRFIEGESRTQVTLLPECLDDYVAEENPVRVVDVFVDELDLGALGFEGVERFRNFVQLVVPKRHSPVMFQTRKGVLDQVPIAVEPLSRLALPLIELCFLRITERVYCPC